MNGKKERGSAGGSNTKKDPLCPEKKNNKLESMKQQQHFEATNHKTSITGGPVVFFDEDTSAEPRSVELEPSSSRVRVFGVKLTDEATVIRKSRYGCGYRSWIITQQLNGTAVPATWQKLGKELARKKTVKEKGKQQ